MNTFGIPRIHLLICLALVVVAQGHFFRSNYKKLENGQALIGTIQGKYTEQWEIYCSWRCSTDSQCIAYQFGGSVDDNCHVIYRNNSEDSGREFLSEAGATLFRKDICTRNCVDGHDWESCEINSDECTSNPCENGGPCEDGQNSYTCDCQNGFFGKRCQTDGDGAWTQPSEWSADDPVIYRQFEDSARLTLHNGAVIFPGKVGNGVKTDSSLTQYVHLGDLSAACMTNPLSCGTWGGTVSLWVKTEQCDGSIISSASNGRQGFIINCLTTMYYAVRLDTSLKTLRITNPPTDWFHLVFVVQGANTDITVYHNKMEQAGTLTDIYGQFSTGSGTTVIGKLSSDQEQLYYGSVIVDELAMWNHALSGAEVAQLYDMYFE